MPSVLIVRRHLVAARRLQAQFETSRELQVCAVCDTLAAARKLTDQHRPSVIVSDLALEDGAALRLLTELRNGHGLHADVQMMAVADRPIDALLFGTMCAGADSFHIDGTTAPSAVSTLMRMLRGEATMNAPLATQVLQYFGLADLLKLPAAGDDRQLDWETDAESPVRLSQGERRMLLLLARGEPLGGVAVRTGHSFEAIGRRLTSVYRKLQWDQRLEMLAVRAA